MELSKQIKRLRKRDSISQETLAETLFVSRQTISNWENEKSYPDVHSLQMLSVFFQVSIDELIKGDFQEIKERLEQHKWNKWGLIMMIPLFLAAVIAVPAVKFDSSILMIVLVLLIIVSFIGAGQVEKYKYKYQIHTYKQVLQYFDESKTHSKQKTLLDFIVTYTTLPFIVFLISLLSYFVFNF